MHVFWYIVFQVLKLFLIKEYKIQVVYQFCLNSYFGNSTIFVYSSWRPLCLWICCGARSVHFTVSPGRKGALFIHIQLHNHQKDLDPCLWLYYYGNFIVELEKKNTNKKHKLFMVLVIWPSSTLNFLFVFDFK